MKSPFPGMDPYLERFWGDVHLNVIANMRNQLNAKLPPDLFARAETQVFLEAFQEEKRFTVPDLNIVEKYRGPKFKYQRDETEDGGVAVAEPIIVSTNSDPVRQHYLEIRDQSSGNRVVTLIELVIPSNKSHGKGKDLFLRKRREAIKGGANIVDIDITRGGQRHLIFPIEIASRSELAEYMTFVKRAWDPKRYEIYPMNLRERLPAIRIPLRKTDTDAVLDIQKAVDLCYVQGRYGDANIYSMLVSPRLEPADAQWAGDLLLKAGLRTGRSKRKKAI